MINSKVNFCLIEIERYLAQLGKSRAIQINQERKLISKIKEIKLELGLPCVAATSEERSDELARP